MTELAEQAYTETKEDFIEWFSDFLEDRITTGLAQIENGQTKDFESFKKGLIGYTLNPKKYENI